MLTHGKTFGSSRWDTVMNSGGSPGEGLKTRKKELGKAIRHVDAQVGIWGVEKCSRRNGKSKVVTFQM